LISGSFSVGRIVRTRHLLRAVGAAPPKRVLDAGCGDGWVSSQLAVRHPSSSIVAIEPDSATRELAANRLRPHSNVSVIPGAIGEPLQERDFDTIVCTDVLEHIRDDAEAVAWLAEHLAPDGRLILHVPRSGQRYLFGSVRRAMNAELGGGKGPHMREGYDPGGIAGLAQRAGLKVTEVANTFHHPLSEFGAELDQWLFIRRLRPLKVLLGPLLLLAAHSERKPGGGRHGRGILLVARRPNLSE
jgi:trans-aconitate methyltransferase